MNMIIKIRNDLSNPSCEGFFMEADGNSLTVRRINRWQFEVTTESWKGYTNTYYKVDAAKVESWAEDMIAMDNHCCYIPHYPTTKWPSDRIDKFMKSLPFKLCDPYFNGFTLSADGVKTYTVQRHVNKFEWNVNGKIIDLGSVLDLTRAKLHENYMWEFEVI
jgi:hypothetical protein